MLVVDESSADALLKECEVCTDEVDRLCEIMDPDSTPYESKYKARKVLGNLCNKLEATRTIASLEKKRDVVNLMSSRMVASIRVRIGTISWECEEPQNAQTDLDLSANYYFEGFIEVVVPLVGNDPDADSGPDGALNEETLQQLKLGKLTPPDISMPASEEIADAMKCLNMLGILWAGRG